jgi:hypothetical protein
MDNSNFIDQFDPTKLLDLNSISIEQQYAKLTDEEKLLVFCRINGYDRIPPSIERMYQDSYYLGGEDFFDGGTSLYQFWKDSLPKIFPSAVLTAKPYLILSGAIGIGKSTVSRLCMAMTYARMLCMKNPSRTLHLTPKPFSFVVVHRDESVARKEFKYWFNDALEKSPFFKNIKPRFKLQFLTSGPMGGSAGLGSDVIFYIISEVNFYPNPERAKGIVKTAYGRLSSRFGRDEITKVGNLILDSSATGDSSVTEWFLDNTPPDLTWNCAPTHWYVKPASYPSGKTFPLYEGDGKYPPQILPMDYKLREDQDPDRVLNVPIELYGEAKQDLIKLLQDKAGVSTGASDSFFGGSVEHVINCSKGRVNDVPEVINVDFYDKSDRLIDKVMPALRSAPLNSTIWLGLDLSTKSDFTGISAVTFDHWETIGSTRIPHIKCYFSLAVSRKEGQQTSLWHIEDLIMSLRKNYHLVVSADQAFSAQILQACDREGIDNNGRISTDNVPCEPALYLKTLFNQEQISIPPVKRLFREAYDLRYVPMSKGLKVDHPKKCTVDDKVFDGDASKGIGSKDVWDSLASACYSLKMSIDAGEEQGYSNGVDKQMTLLKRMTNNPTEETQKVFQGFLENIF